jgi:thiol-disulfide isomerase/thioredoxin
MFDKKSLMRLKFIFLRIFFIIFLVSFIFTTEILAQSGISSKVKIIDVSDLKLILEAGKGSPILINVWATWCEPCREEFPDLVDLSAIYKEDIRFISISVDDFSDLEVKVVPFLKNQNVQFESYLLKVVEPEDFINLLDKDWSGAVPATFIYDKNGNQTEALIGKQSFEMFEREIKKVID